MATSECKREFERNTAGAWGKFWQAREFQNKWDNRNLQNGRLFITTLEIEYVEFEQDFFAPKSQELISKLIRLGFGYYTTGKVNNFGTLVELLFNPKLDIAIHLYDERYKSVFANAFAIANDTGLKGQDKSKVFLSAIKINTANLYEGEKVHAAK